MIERSSHRLKARLGALADAVPRGARVADIGSDHGRLPRFLVESGRASHCIATECAPGPYRRLRGGVASGLASGAIETRLGSGIEPLELDDRLDAILVAGMGGYKILSFVDPPRLAQLGVRRLVLQPQSEWPEVRRTLAERGWPLASERLVEDRGRLYTVMVATPEAAPTPPPPAFSADEWWLAGPCWIRDGEPLAARFWELRRERAQRRLERVEEAGRVIAAAEIELAERVLATIAQSSVR